MDVLGLLSNISQVVDLLVKIGVMCSIYCFDVKNAPKEVRLLLREVDRLTVVIKELEILLNGTKGASKIESPVLRQTVFDLRKLLAELVAKLDLGAKNTSRAMWPFKKREIHDILATIDRQKANIVLNMSIEQTSILIDVHQEFVLSKLRVAEAATFDSSVDGEQSYCLPGTRTEVIAQIRHWSAEQNGQSIFWLNGMAGTGKSTISRTVAQLSSNSDVLGASFFFKRGEGNRGRAAFLFTTIAAQLVRRLPCLAPSIREALVVDPFIHEKPLNDQFQKLILDPLSKNPRCWGSNLLIVIDALDECGSEDDMRTLISVFSKAQDTTSPRVKFFLTSRPELPIRLGFENIGGKYDNLLLASVPATTIALDIELFMRNKLQTIKTDYNTSVSEHRKIKPDWPGEDMLQKLIATAIPLFIAAATICRFLSDRRLGSPHHQLNKFLEYQTIKISGMDMTYLPVLDRLIAGLSPSRKQEVLHRFRYLIGSIITLARPLSIRSLSRLLGITTDIIEDQLDLLHSVLSVPTDLNTPGTDAQAVGNLLRDARRFILANLSTMNKAPLQIYSSALVFAPEKSVVRELFDTSIPFTITFTDISTGITLTIEGVDDDIIPFVFFSSGQQLICPMKSTVGSGRRAIGIWNTMTATCETILEGHRANISDIILSSDEKRIASASYDKSIRIWDAQSGCCIATYIGHDEIIYNIAYSSDGTLLISLDEQGSSKIWDAHSEIQPQTIAHHESAVLEVVLSPNKKRAVTTAGERTIKLWDTATGECITTGETHVLFANVPLVVPRDLLSAPYDHVIYHSDLYGWPRSIQFCQDSSKFVSSTGLFGPTTIKLWETDTGSYELLYETKYGPATSIAISPNGRTVSSTLREGMVMHWDTVSRQLLSFLGGETHDLSYSSFSPDGAYLMLGYMDGAVRLYHLSARKWKEMRARHEGSVTLITVSADGTRLATYDVGEIRIWATDTYAAIAKYELASRTSEISQILFSPDSRYLIALYTTGKVKVEFLCASTGHSIAQLEMCGLANHMEFDSAGSSLLITTNVGTLTVDPPSFQNAKSIGLGLSNDGEWITWDSRNLLWLPPTFRISASDIDVAASLIALGTRLGRLLLIGIDSSRIPPPTAMVDATNVP
ncbi:hypothetical protein MKX08_001206 [Trichoderma sp. CBMAI-0020]|nr:hypothetical protein MKX08_001206 [Trichoderma sp. CBMAI-0020]